MYPARLLQPLFQSIIPILFFSSVTDAQTAPIVPSAAELSAPFSPGDYKAFANPAKVFYPETWFHFIGGNVSKPGITEDLNAIAASGISGIQLFHGQFGGPWPGVSPQIACLSPLWEDAIRHTAQECRRLGLKFTMQNCPGWAMAGGPWIPPQNAMRQLVYSRAEITGGKTIKNLRLDLPKPDSEPWRDYKDIAVLAFPTPADDSAKALIPAAIQGDSSIAWKDVFTGTAEKSIRLAAALPGHPYTAEIEFSSPTIIRTLQLPSVNSLAHAWNYEPGINIKLEVFLTNGKIQTIVDTKVPKANFQDHAPVSFSCTEAGAAKKFRLSIENQHDIRMGAIHFFSSARINNWESEAGFTLRSIDHINANFQEQPNTAINPSAVIDISKFADTSGNLSWAAPVGNWTIFRIGHVNSGKQNGPAPPEGTGWESNKLSVTGADAHFAGYIGRLSADGAAVGNGLLNGMLMDSWECETQTWTANMEKEFSNQTGYPLRKWMPAIFGFVMKDQETSFRFLRDWRSTINQLFVNNFYGRMAQLAKARNLAVSYETSAGDVFPGDILEYYKFADVPMCEFWQPFSDGFVGSLNFKPIKPAASAARLYGKPRLGAEAFTSFSLTWDEHWQALKEVANINMVEGVTHLIYHTYTHNPKADSLFPGTSFGAGIGTPFLRQQTWWKHMPALNTYFARCSYLQERGKPVSDVLWYLGDEIDHVPDQQTSFPEGFKYDYCNPDILLNRLSVTNGMLQTPEGIQYRVLWMPSANHMLPETLEKIQSLLYAGGTIIGNAPRSLGTLSQPATAQNRFNNAVKKIWGDKSFKGMRKAGKGTLVAGTDLNEALLLLGISPDVTGGNALWTHRKTSNADWYFVTAPKGSAFKGTLNFRTRGDAEIWDPVTGKTKAVNALLSGKYSRILVELPQAGSCFIVFQHNPVQHMPAPQDLQPVSDIVLTAPWTLKFPAGWGAPDSLQLPALTAWKDLAVAPEAKAFSGTVSYSTHFRIDTLQPAATYTLQLGSVNMIAKLTLNGKPLGTVWCEPYAVDLSSAIRQGNNDLQVEVTSTWFNRLSYDASLPEDKRKTWTISGPPKDAPLKSYGLLGPVRIEIVRKGLQQ